MKTMWEKTVDRPIHNETKKNKKEKTRVIIESMSLKALFNIIQFKPFIS